MNILQLFGGNKGFEKQVVNDSIKRKYCRENNIPLLEIKYDLQECEVKSLIDDFIKTGLAI